MFVQQSGANRHEHICESLEVFASQVMPEFKERDQARAAQKQRELAPYIEAASPILSSDRGGAISIPTQDPFAAREGERP